MSGAASARLHRYGAKPELLPSTLASIYEDQVRCCQAGFANEKESARRLSLSACVTHSPVLMPP